MLADAVVVAVAAVDGVGGVAARWTAGSYVASERQRRSAWTGQRWSA